MLTPSWATTHSGWTGETAMTDERTRTEIREAIVAMVAEIAELDPAQLPGDRALRSELKVDSLSLVELVIAIEQEFGVRIPDEEARALLTIDDHVAYVEGAD